MTANEPGYRIMGFLFAQHLAELGLIEDIASVCRIVIDVQPDAPLTVWVQRYGDTRWLDVRMPDGVVVQGQP